MSWMIDAVKELGDKMKPKKKEIEVPIPSEHMKAIVLNDEELKYVPEDKKDYYMTLKQNDPEIAANKLETWKIDAQQVEKIDKPVQQVQVVTTDELILMKLDQILQKLG